jgi:RHS repeat-associated protein
VNALVLRDSIVEVGPTLRLWVIQDANWNVVALVNASGSVVERFDYTPFGSVTQLNPAGTAYTGANYNWVYLWQGGRLDTVTGNLQFEARDYSPVLMRWMTNDPIGLGGGDPDLYRIENNDPIDNTDPTGLYAEPKDPEMASQEAKDFIKNVLPQFIEQLKDAAKNTGKLERGGFILKSKDGKTFTFVELKSKETTGGSHHREWFPGSDGKAKGGRIKQCENGVLDLDKKGGKVDNNNTIQVGWHTHPAFPDGEAPPSERDGTAAKKESLIEVVVQYNPETKEWSISIVDTDGKYFEYIPPKEKK